MRRAGLCVLVLLACDEPPAPSADRPTVGPAPVPAKEKPAADASMSFACGGLTLTFGASFPADLSLANQTDADCYAWQEFIALSWPSLGADFGAPGDLSDVQWQGWMDGSFARLANHKKLSGSCADILAHREALWTFVVHEGVEPTNNLAERDLRPLVLWRKRSFGSRMAGFMKDVGLAGGALAIGRTFS